MKTEKEPLVIQIEALDRKLDAIHESLNGRLAEMKVDMRDDLNEIKGDTKKTNGRVTKHDRDIAWLKGVVAAVVAGMPFAVFALSHLT